MYQEGTFYNEHIYYIYPHTVGTVCYLYIYIYIYIYVYIYYLCLISVTRLQIHLFSFLSFEATNGSKQILMIKVAYL
jgi:hypothetical protein